MGLIEAAKFIGERVRDRVVATQVEAARKKRFIELHIALSRQALSFSQCGEIFFIARQPEWYGEGKPEHLRKPWAKNFQTAFYACLPEDRTVVYGQWAQTVPAGKLADMVGLLYEAQPPSASDGTGNWKEELLGGLQSCLREGAPENLAVFQKEISGMQGIPATIQLELKEKLTHVV